MTHAQQAPLPGEQISLGPLIQQFSNALTLQRYARAVPVFDGDPKQYKGWMKALEKHHELTNSTPRDSCLLAYEMTQGVASDVIKRYLIAHPGTNWEQMKEMLSKRFAPVTCPEYAFAMLGEMRQGEGESARMLADRVVDLAEEAFRGDRDRPLVEKQIVHFYIDALREDYLKLRILRENPDNLARAIEIAATEENLRLRFTLRQKRRGEPARRETVRETVRGRDNRTEERMEVDHARSRGRCFYCDQPGHLKRECRKREADRKAQYPPYRRSAKLN